ncbi:MAG: phospho-N-acetylmuramoyl-pentapeptide-transferase [Thermoleophilia bacterium]|nr:phospho-N-acetylmuramoyl-pentapeptide-transferase [Thermoleophilia bacterium]
MVRVLIATVVAMLISIVAGPKFIEFLRRRELGQHIRAELPAGHVVKQGTPTAGGVLIVFAATLAFLALSRYSTAALTVFFAMVACAAVGFADDVIKLRHRRSLGLSGRWKLLLLAAISAVVGYVAYAQLELSTRVLIPVAGVELPLSWFWYAFLFFIVAGAANGVNLTDGIDGLAAGTGIIAIFTFTAIAVFTSVRTGQLVGEQNIPFLDMAILGGALIGASIGFLWYNAFPAEVFMGDTGSMAIGGALAGFAIMMKAEVLLLLIGGIFALEALSVMVQVFTFKYLGRRVFLMTPIHHHFEMKAWSDAKIMVRFWIVTGILCAVGFALYYSSYDDFRRLRNP